MGTAYNETNCKKEEHGIIPRAVEDIFYEVSQRQDSEFVVKVSFIELYKENLFDLLNVNKREDSILDIREDPKGGIKLNGLTELSVVSLNETMKCLEQGSINRATGATAMNSHSSRSHAIFSLHIEQRNKSDSSNITSAKFHMVDLAGSERAKKTGATGERFKEGVNINRGLLALGNVISALCEDNNRGHIPYRDSKLTRLLQDSLGGNSHTLMIACVSPADSNYEETISTLRYADRARKIKNKPIVNHDPQTAEINKLRQQIQQLQVQMLSSNTMGQSNTVVNSEEVKCLLDENSILKDENEKLTRALQAALEENTSMAEKALLAEMSRDKFKVKLEELRAQTGTTVENLNKTFDVSINPQYEEQINLVKELQTKVIELQCEQKKSETALFEHEFSRHQPPSNNNSMKEEAVANSEENTDLKNGESNQPDFGVAYTLRQAKLNEELQELNKALIMKEELMSKMTTNDNEFTHLKPDYEKNLKSMEEQIDILMKEKDELTQRLKHSSSAASSKIAEQRRKKVQELETQISNLKKKIMEQGKQLKFKEQTERKLSKLGSEISSMKATRVKLIRQLKEDNEKFRVWKMQKDREVAKLKEADRKKEYKIVKMERLHSKQQNVLKRKMEEAVAINKRLKDAMALQKACSEKRATSKDTENVANKIKHWLEGEIEVMTVKKQAQNSLKMLIEDRKIISDQLLTLKSEVNNGEITSPLMMEDKKSKLEELENELQLRSAQICDLQAKVTDDDAEVVNKKRFESVQSMIEAKHAMKYLFDNLISSKAIYASKESDMNDLQMQYDDISNTVEEYESIIKSLKNEHNSDLEKLSREHEDKILYMLAKLNDKNNNKEQSQEQSNSALQKEIRWQENEIIRLSALHGELQKKTEECEKLKEQMKNMISKSEIQTIPKIIVPVNKQTKTAQSKKNFTFISDDEVFSSDDDNDDEEDEDDDPDWCKTPIYKRIVQFKNSRNRDFGHDDESTTESRGNATILTNNKRGTKRNSFDDVKCGCKTPCSSNRCSCVSNGSSCGENCKCNKRGDCKNTAGKKDDVDSTSSSIDTVRGDTFLNSTFDVNAQEDNVERKKKKPRLSAKDNSDSLSDSNENKNPNVPVLESNATKSSINDIKSRSHLANLKNKINSLDNFSLLNSPDLFDK